MMMGRNLVVPLLVAVSLCGVSGAILYLLLRKDEEEGVRSSMDKYQEIEIPNNVVPGLIGRGGSNIKDLQQMSGARINFKDAEAGNTKRICIIRGQPSAIRVAEGLIRDAVASHVPPEESFMLVPGWATGRIIGRGGEVIRDICHTSGAKVKMEDKGLEPDYAANRKVVVKGTPEQIKLALEIIDQIVKAEIVRRENSRREPRGQYAAVGSSDSPTATDPTDLTDSTGNKKSTTANEVAPAPLTPEGAGALLEVFVSAVSSPARFWMQIVGPQVQKLDKLVDEMTEYYTIADNRELHKLSDVQVGQLVATVYRHDGKWYRAKVAEIKQNEFDGRQQVCDVHFVDYGDNEYVGREELFGLRTDMLQLRFQAVECFLAGVQPAADHGERWDPRGIERFEELTQVARWKRLWSRTCAFREREVTGATTPRGGRESSPVPGVKLYDVQDGQDVDIGDVLIKEGWGAVLEEPTPPTPIIPPDNPMPAYLPPSFGDLESSRVLGMLIGGGTTEKREERAISLPHGGVSPRDSPLPDRNAGGDSGLYGDSKGKSSSLAAGMDHQKTFKTISPPGIGSITELSYPTQDVTPPAHLNGLPHVTNGSHSKQNGAFINAEREHAVSPPPDSLKHNPESFTKAHPLHLADPKDELKAKMNRVDSHHGNLETLGRHTLPNLPSPPVLPNNQ